MCKYYRYFLWQVQMLEFTQSTTEPTDLGQASYKGKKPEGEEHLIPLR